MGFYQIAQMISVLTLAVTFPPDGMPWDHGRLQVSDNDRFIQHEDGTAFYWLGDTAWEFFHRASRSERIQFLDNRQTKGFSVIQCVLLAEIDGLNTPTPEGHRPLLNNDPTTPDIKPGPDNDYWDEVDFILTEAENRGMYLGILPTWGDKVDIDDWGVGPVIFNPSNAYIYGEFVGERYKDRPNIIWINGGDRNPDTPSYIDTWNALAQGVKARDPNHLMTFHPQGWYSSSIWFHNETWLDFNMMQSGHGAYHLDNYSRITSDYNLAPVKPTLEGEPRYEDHPVNWNPSNGYFRDADVREAAYWSIFAGGFGHTYGHHSIWQWYSPSNYSINYPDRYWYEALDRPGAFDMTHVKALMISRPFFTRVPDQSILAMDASSGENRVQATRGNDYLFVYTGNGRTLTINMGRIGGSDVNAWWYNPREGTVSMIGTYTNTGTRTFDPPGGQSFGNDWILVVDNVTRTDFPEPGQAIFNGNYTPLIDPPSNLAVTALSSSEVSLSWDDNSSDPNEDGFIIQRKPYASVNEWHQLDDLGPDTTSYTDTDSLHGLVTYTYRVGVYKN